MVLDPGTAVGITSLVLEVAKDLYWYYSTWKGCDSDVKELRVQLLWILDACKAVQSSLDRPGISSNLESLVNTALRQCLQAIDGLREVLQKIRPENFTPQTALQKLKSQGRKVVYPFRKSTVQNLAENVETCCENLQFALSLLKVDLEASSLEKLQLLDTRLETRLTDVQKDLEAAQESKDLTTKMLLEKIEELRIDGKAQIDRSIAETHGARDLLLEQQERAARLAESEKKTQAIIKSLTYPKMNARRRAVTDAHQETLEWIFEQVNGRGHNVVRRRTAALKLTSFLRNDLRVGTDIATRVLWTRGKPGSGKSSFMKFLIDRPQTQAILRKWSGAKPLLIVEHFFWIAGTPMQRSYGAFLQHLLYQLLSMSPSLVPAVCKQRLQSDHDLTHSPWSVRELTDCLQALLRGLSASHVVTETGTKASVCFFIDGMDECHPDSDHHKLMHTLRELASHDHVKIVLSSRPWSVFEQYLITSPNILTMEELNRSDIANTIYDRLKEASTGQTVLSKDWGQLYQDLEEERRESPVNDTERFIRYVLSKADGVFLWVHLILNALCDRLSARQSVRQLMEHVDKTPAEIMQYFREMILERIHQSWFSETAMALKIALITAGQTQRSSLFFWMLSQSKDHRPGSLWSPDFEQTFPFTVCTTSQIRHMLREAHYFIAGCAKDLIFVSKPLQDDDKMVSFEEHSFEFIHRTLQTF